MRSPSIASYSRSTAGVAPRCTIRRIASSPSVKRRERERGADLGRRAADGARSRAPTMMPERAFGADEQLREVGADRGARRTAGRDARAVGEHDVEAGDDVFDLPVAGRELAGAAARDPTADGRQRHRLRPVSAGDAVLGRGARPRTRRRRCPGSTSTSIEVVVDVDDAFDRGEVEQHPAEHGHARAAHAAAARGGGHGNPCFVAQSQDRGDLARQSRAHDHDAARAST